MDYEEWNKTQQYLFELFFKNSDEYSIPIEELISLYQRNHIKWEKLYGLLRNNTDNEEFDKYSTLNKINYIIFNKMNYIIIEETPYTYYFIDQTNKKVLTKEQISDELLNTYILINQKKIIKKEDITSFYISNNLKKIIDLLSNNQDIFEIPYVYYPIKNNNYITSLTFHIDTNKITLHFGQYKGHVNYIFIDSNLNPIGVSNPTDNKEELKVMCKRLNQIRIPLQISKEV